MSKYVFTMTAGRTGTAWLADLFDVNFNCTSVHEYLNFGDIGLRSQDIGIMQAFNEWGNNDRVKIFWKRKFSLVPQCDLYVETNHALGKCGLIENLEMLPEGSDISIITMRRNWLKQTMSYLDRFDFHNYTVPWQWYLDMRYQNRIVPASPFKDKGMLGHVVWYVAEVEARQAYYRQMFGDRYNFVDAKLESATTQKGAQKLLARFGHEGPVFMPDKTNTKGGSKSGFDPKMVGDFIERIKFDPEELAADYIKNGRRLDERFQVPQNAPAV